MRHRRETMAKLLGSVWEMAGTVSRGSAEGKISSNNELSLNSEDREQTSNRTSFQRKTVKPDTL
jgi:hypothetical protein